MISNKTRELINLAINNLELNNPTQLTIDNVTKYLKEAIIQIKKDKEEQEVEKNINEEDVPFIVINYYSPKIEDTQDVIIPFYATDFYQKEYLKNDNSIEFKLRYEIDGNVKYTMVKSGDNEVNFGKLEKGIHWYTLQLEDKYGRQSRRICNEIWVINKNEYDIKESETYIVTDNDLSLYNINRENSEILEDMKNNRMGLTNLFKNLQEQGYRKCILPKGIYRVNRALRNGTGEQTPIDIPTNFTVDMNGSTFKLHPYNDSEYGSIAHVENLIVRMKDTFDSHLINGIVEGDYAERKEKGWISGSNGEGSNGITISGGDYCSLDNITITQITGYNSGVGQSGNLGSGRLGAWEDNVVVKNGVDMYKEGYTTSKLGTMNADMLANHYIVASVWLGFGGLKGLRWDIEFHFYDENENFIESIRSYQYTRCRIPAKAKYFRVTFFAKASEMNGLSIHCMKSSRNCEFNNCHWIDNRTCSASCQFQHLTFKNCDFTRSGQSITPCEIDLEDGWEQMQDFFLEGCEIKEHVGTGCLIDNAGLNHQVENCKNFNFTARYRIRGITMRNNENCGLGLTVGFMTGNTVRCYNNTMPSFSYGDTGEYFEHEKMNYIIKNNTLDAITSNSGGKAIVDNCILTGLGGDNCVVINSELYRTRDVDYIHDNMHYENCIFKILEGQSEIKFSFNKANAKRIYERCIFEAPTFFAPHNGFNSGIWNNCTFKDTLFIKTNNTTLCMGQIQYNNCIFEKDVTIYSRSCQIQFNNCQFLGNIIYQDNAKQLVEFNDEMPTVSKYVKINDHLDYVNINQPYSLSAEVLPYTATNIMPIWESSDKNIVEVDNEGNLLMKKEGTCNIIAKNYENTVSDSTGIHFVDVDYNLGQYIQGGNGSVRNLPYNVLNNRYDEVNKTNITITTPIPVSIIRVAQYDSNKNFIKLTNIQNYGSTINSGTCNLDSNCKYVRMAFRQATSTEKRFPELFANYTID